VKRLMALALAAMLLGVMATQTAWAQRGRHGGHGGGHHHGGHHHGGHSHVSVGVGFGFGGYWPGYWGPGWGWPGYWGAPYYPYYSAPVVTSGPTTYIERADEAREPASTARRDWWYLCPETKTYYPYVKECPGGWQKVEPQPAAER
jgi:hypothetical protein